MTNNVDALLNNAFAAYNAGRFDEAEALTREALQTSPSSGDGLYLLGLIAFQANALEAAADLLYQAKRLYPDNTSYTLTLASVLQAAGRLDEAITLYDAYPDNAQGWAQKGNIYLLKKQDSFAENAFQKALSLAPDLPEAVIGLARLDWQAGMAAQAEHRLQSLCRDRMIPDAAFLLAQIYREHHRLDEALLMIESALSETSRAPYLMEKGLIAEEKGDFETALSAYRQATDLNPYQADSWTNQGNIYRQTNRLKQAEDAYKRALQQDLNNIEAHHNLALCLEQMDRLPEALEHYRSVLSRHPDYVPSLYNLAVILEKTGDYAESAGLYFNALSLGCSFPDLDWRIADTLTALYAQDKKQARRFADGWQKNFPDNPVARHTYAALSGKGDTSSLSEYTRRLYDSFAPEYDTKMTELASTALQTALAFLPDKHYQSVLDLACGTGLLGVQASFSFDTLTGVDISGKMLDKARETARYTRLVEQDIVAFLEHDKQTYDLLLAIEVVGYLPTVQPLFQQIASHLSRNGVFVFSVETADKTGLSLNGRFLYSAADIDKALSAANLTVLKRDKTALRREGQGVAKGEVILVRKITE